MRSPLLCDKPTYLYNVCDLFLSAVQSQAVEEHDTYQHASSDINDDDDDDDDDDDADGKKISVLSSHNNLATTTDIGLHKIHRHIVKDYRCSNWVEIIYIA